ncbi:hypothetical protein [Chryseobacterium lathyri]|uniref:hypothetical protein n=1 Tax=Chryseobacterium lathyri TaxID=395933 RepID=UPI001CBEFE61|nr:hypothetical protein [Chryseobacterium lathyri]
MKTIHDNELLAKLKTEIKENTIIIHENIKDLISEIEANYPMGFSGIDWDKKKPLFFIDFNSEANLLEKVDDEFLKILNAFPELLNEKLIVIGDNLTELGYEASFKDFIGLNKLFLSIPQHVYLWFPKIKKCINITFENELIFG